MEIPAVPQRRPARAWRWRVIGVVAVAVVAFGVLIPVTLGLRVTVVGNDDLAGRVDRGTVLFTLRTTSGAVERGDTIRFKEPADYGDKSVVRQVDGVNDLGIRTVRTGAIDPWQLPAGTAVSKVVASVPYAGYPILGAADPAAWLVLAAILGSGLVVLAIARLVVAERGRRRGARETVVAIARQTGE